MEENNMKIDRIQEIKVKVLMVDDETNEICSKIMHITGMDDVEISGSPICMDNIVNGKNSNTGEMLRLDVFFGKVTFEDQE